MITKFDLYLAQIIGMQMHPGFFRENAKRMTLEEQIEMAELLTQISDRREQCQSEL